MRTMTCADDPSHGIMITISKLYIAKRRHLINLRKDEWGKKKHARLDHFIHVNYERKISESSTKVTDVGDEKIFS